MRNNNSQHFLDPLHIAEFLIQAHVCLQNGTNCSMKQKNGKTNPKIACSKARFEPNTVKLQQKNRPWKTHLNHPQLLTHSFFFYVGFDSACTSPGGVDSVCTSGLGFGPNRLYIEWCETYRATNALTIQGHFCCGNGRLLGGPLQSFRKKIDHILRITMPSFMQDTCCCHNSFSQCLMKFHSSSFQWLS